MGAEQEPQQGTGQQEPGLPVLDALGPGGPYRTHTREQVRDVTGAVMAEMSLVPALFVNRAMKALHAAAPLPAAERASALARAAELFRTATLGGLTLQDYEAAVTRVSGLPVEIVRVATQTCADRVSHSYRSVQLARPRGAVSDWRDPLVRTTQAVWTRRGDVLAVHVPGNHPGTHGFWPEALALGYRVAVRASTREPFTAHRLVLALREAGFGNDHVVLLPCGHEAADAIVSSADLAYGGDEIIRRYADDPGVLSLQPGRSKILLTADTDWRDHLDMIVDSVSRHAGSGCVNATAVLVEGDPAPLAGAIAERLAALPSLPPYDDKARLPVQNTKAARALEKFVLDRAKGTRAWLGGAGFVDELGDGSAVLRPVVHQVDSADAPQLSAEVPFPCVWVAPWSREDGVEPLRDTLVLTVVTEDEHLVEALIDEPTISNLHVGSHATHWHRPGLPHDGYLGEFLMRSKTVVRV
ncbi:aldehyde dehydrogenase family protein [Streptomyces sp. SID13666]|uniref:aldehyde dehydrogenase family protein n=1 Tax=unclassified Streptomyces TaxID=2593676 RepID=UPI0013BF7614|nr:MULTISPECIES: aldehyde dehydrogenase family protein [unclassified Streptomyces]NEA55080.1 aldehyde dehydrogenase family protein [Streptomyces sp. SID13666]NEA71087.1 aldehyde dehydrogenase family protein [Streptomyces sp. SID13588]